MPLGVCGTCERAYIFESAPEKGQDCCPRCGTVLTRARVTDLRPRPEQPIRLNLCKPSEAAVGSPEISNRA